MEWARHMALPTLPSGAVLPYEMILHFAENQIALKVFPMPFGRYQ
jgi:hypothetical protein